MHERRVDKQLEPDMSVTPYEQSVVDRRAAARIQRAQGGSLADYGAREQSEWLGGARTPANGQLTVFRAVREGDGMQPGDYVTNSRAYARQHLDDNLGGQGRVIEALVHLDEIFPADGPKEFWYLPRSLEATHNIAFEKWFGASKVTDASGAPLMVYHGTWRAFDGDSFKRDHDKRININQSLGFHFGSREAANDRIAPQLRRLMRHPKAAQKDGVQPAIMAVYLSLQNPMRLPDVGAWHDTAVVASALLTAGFKLPNQLQFFNATHSRGEGLDLLQVLIEAAGYDGVIYRNAKEGKGADSFIAFHAAQIQNAMQDPRLERAQKAIVALEKIVPSTLKPKK